MIELALIAIGAAGVTGAALRWLHNGPAGSMRKGVAVAILGAGGPGAVPR
jgi:hypothetical protein